LLKNDLGSVPKYNRAPKGRRQCELRNGSNDNLSINAHNHLKSSIQAIGCNKWEREQEFQSPHQQ
jgi:hypothetical protein